MEIITNITYMDGPVVQAWFDEDEKDEKISVEFWDTDAVKILYTHEDISESGGWCSPNAKYFVNWKIKIFYDGDLIKVEDFDLKDKKVIIINGSNCIGDTLAWIPYIEEFRKKYKCDVTYSTSHRKLFSNQYKNINLVNYNLIEISSDFGKYNIDNYDTIFSKNVIITYLDNKIKGEYLDFSLEKKLMIISRDVIIKNNEISIKADVIEINIET